MKAVAEKAGVSVMSVSRALRNDRGISAASRKRILGIAVQLGYRPNPLVGALMANLRRTCPKESYQTIAYITSHASPNEWRDFVAPRMFYEGAARRAEGLGFRLQDFWLNRDEMPGPRLTKVLETRAIRGVIIAPSPFSFLNLFNLAWEKLAPAALGYSHPQLQMHRVTNHQLHTIRLALSKLTSFGYRRIGLAIPTHYNARVDENWSAGYFDYQDKVPPKHRIPILLRPELNAKMVQAWLRRHRPDAVVGGVPIDWLRKGGFKIPDDLGYAELAYTPSMGDIAGVDQNFHAVGAAATDLVVSQLYRNETGLPEIAKVVMVEGKWHPGSTVRDLNGTKPTAIETRPKPSRTRKEKTGHP